MKSINNNEIASQRPLMLFKRYPAEFQSKSAKKISQKK